MKSVQVHRFHDFVAMSVGSGETIYLKHDEATEVSKQMLTAAIDIRQKRFTKSDFKTFNLEVDGTQYQRVELYRTSSSILKRNLNRDLNKEA